MQTREISDYNNQKLKTIVTSTKRTSSETAAELSEGQKHKKKNYIFQLSLRTSPIQKNRSNWVIRSLRQSNSHARIAYNTYSRYFFLKAKQSIDESQAQQDCQI